MNKKLVEIFNGDKEVLIYCSQKKIYEIMSSFNMPKEYGLYKKPSSYITSFNMNGTTINFINIKQLQK